MCQGFSYFSGFLHHSVLSKLATSSTRVNSAISNNELPSLNVDGSLKYLNSTNAG